LTSRYAETRDILDQRFCKQFSIGLQDYIVNRRFNTAKELLRFTIIPVDEVLEQSGMKDTKMMQQMFRENKNMSAEEYRSKWAQWIK
jgi:transcriptional regulator GlxA family with amidase domain